MTKLILISNLGRSVDFYEGRNLLASFTSPDKNVTIEDIVYIFENHKDYWIKQ